MTFKIFDLNDFFTHIDFDSCQVKSCVYIDVELICVNIRICFIEIFN